MASGDSVLLFPGQGSPLDDGAATVAEFAPELGTLAAELTGREIFSSASESTAYAQPAIYCLGVARWIAAGRPAFDRLAGHSLGDVTALAVAGAWSISDGLRVVCARGRAMADAADADGGMLAMRVDPEQAAEIARRAGVVVANDNGPSQQVLSGNRSLLEKAGRIASESKIRSTPLAVAGAFHSPDMDAAIGDFMAAMERMPPARPELTVYSSRSAAPFGEDIAAELAASLSAPVHWRELVLGLERSGVERFVEVGPGRMLGNMIRRIAPEVETQTLTVPEPAGAVADA